MTDIQRVSVPLWRYGESGFPVYDVPIRYEHQEPSISVDGTTVTVKLLPKDKPHSRTVGVPLQRDCFGWSRRVNSGWVVPGVATTESEAIAVMENYFAPTGGASTHVYQDAEWPYDWHFDYYSLPPGGILTDQDPLPDILVRAVAVFFDQGHGSISVDGLSYYAASGYQKAIRNWPVEYENVGDNTLTIRTLSIDACNEV